MNALEAITAFSQILGALGLFFYLRWRTLVRDGFQREKMSEFAIF